MHTWRVPIDYLGIIVKRILRTQIVLPLQPNSTECFSTLDELVKDLQDFKVDHYVTVGDGHDSIVHYHETCLKHIDLGPWAKTVLAESHKPHIVDKDKK